MIKKELLDYIRLYVDITDVHCAIQTMEKTREPLYNAAPHLQMKIEDILTEYGAENDLQDNWWCDEIDVEQIVFEL